MAKKKNASGYTVSDRDKVIRTIIGEAGGEGPEGMEAVAHVLMNRALSGQYSSDLTRVATQKSKAGYHQFSTWNDPSRGGNSPGKWSKNSKEYKTAAAALEAVINGTSPDVTGGAVQYHVEGLTPYWADEANTNGTIKVGNHVFYPANEAPTPMPGRPAGMGNERPESHLDLLLPNRAQYGVLPQGGEQVGRQVDAAGIKVGEANAEWERLWGSDMGVVGRPGLQAMLTPKTEARPVGPQGRRPEPGQPIAAPTAGETRAEQNMLMRREAEAGDAGVMLPRVRPEPPAIVAPTPAPGRPPDGLGFDPLPAPAPLRPQSGLTSRPVTTLRIDPETNQVIEEAAPTGGAVAGLGAAGAAAAGTVAPLAPSPMPSLGVPVGPQIGIEGPSVGDPELRSNIRTITQRPDGTVVEANPSQLEPLPLDARPGNIPEFKATPQTRFMDLIGVPKEAQRVIAGARQAPTPMPSRPVDRVPTLAPSPMPGRPSFAIPPNALMPAPSPRPRPAGGGGGGELAYPPPPVFQSTNTNQQLTAGQTVNLSRGRTGVILTDGSILDSDGNVLRGSSQR